MLSRSLFRLQQQQSPSSSSIPDPSMGKVAEKVADTTGNAARTGGFFRRLQKAVGFMITYAQNKPVRFSGWVFLFFASIFWYEANVTHGGRVRSWSHSKNEYQIDDSEEGRKVRKVKAEKVVSPREQAAMMEETKGTEKRKIPQLPGNEEGGQNNFQRPASTMYVTRGHLQEKENNWNVRNHERNWSILAQDHYKQKDSFAYRLERSKDDDFGRHAAKQQQQ